MSYILKFLIAIMLFTEPINHKKQLKLTKNGFDRILMGEKLDKEIRLDLRDIDTTTIRGELEYRTVEEGMHDPHNSVCKILKSTEYQIHGFESIPTKIFIGYTLDEKVEHIVVELDRKHFDMVMKNLESVFGPPHFLIKGGMNGNNHQSYAWSISGIDIYFSGLVGLLTFSYPKPD